MMTLTFAGPDAAAWMADVDDFTDDASFPRLPFEVAGVRTLVNPDGSGRHMVTGSTRIDFCPFELMTQVGTDEDGNPVMESRGWHVNVLLSEAAPGRPTGAHQAVAAAIGAWFSPKPRVDHDTPDEVLAAFNAERRKVHTTDRGSKLIDPPVVAPKRTWGAP